ncbi:MAG: hypothetical protein QOE80_3571 [Actinomycetota bacterium]|nr:hypothetical protein [Actinomycetota bacterium]
MPAVTQEILVRGCAQARAMPDRAQLSVTVAGEGPSRNGAYGEAAEQANAVDGVIATYGDALDRAATAALVVQPKTPYRKGESVRTGWRATRPASTGSLTSLPTRSRSGPP